MKTAQEWISGMAVFATDNKLRLVRSIQRDALATAAEICLEVAKVSRVVSREGTDCAAAIIKEADKLMKEAVVTKEFAEFTCKFGQGETCCKYLTVGPWL